MPPKPSYATSRVRYEPAHWLSRGHAPNKGAIDWSKWPGITSQWDKEANAGLDITQVPTNLTTVAWHWRCDQGHEWREPTASRLAGWPNRPPHWKLVTKSWAACRECTLDRYGMVHLPCGHVSPELGHVASPRLQSPRLCERCEGRVRLPPDGTAFKTNHIITPTKDGGRLRDMLARRLPLADPSMLNAIVVPQTSWGARWLHPDMMVPGARVVIEYDSPGSYGKAGGAEPKKDREQDLLLRRCGWEVVRVRAGGLRQLGPRDVLCGSHPDVTVAEQVAGQYRRILMERARAKAG